MRLVDVVRPAAALEQLGQDRVRLHRADAARHALAARLVAEEPQHVRRGGEQVRALGHHDQRAGAEHRAGLGERVEVERHVEARPGPRKFDDAPPGWNAEQLAARRCTPPASSISSRAVVPIGTQYTSGFSTCPDTAKNFSPVPPLTPWAFHHSAPRVER